MRFALPFAVLALAACTVETPGTPPPVAEGPGTWRLVSLNGALPESAVTLRIDGARIEGRGPCNRYFAPVQAGGAGLFRPGPVGATKMACDGLAEEARYFDALSRVTRIDRTGVQMRLTGPGVRLDYAMPMN